VKWCQRLVAGSRCALQPTVVTTPASIENIIFQYCSEISHTDLPATIAGFFPLSVVCFSDALKNDFTTMACREGRS
jgi:hypothetical protein